jgi:hypothetical protein
LTAGNPILPKLQHKKMRIVKTTAKS